MPDLKEVEALIKDVGDRLAAMPNALGEDAIKEIVRSVVDGMLNDPDSDAYRKMRFAKSPRALIGSKFARYNLDAGDIEMLYDIMTSAKASGVAKGPSEELTKAFNTISSAFYLSDEEIKAIDRQAIDNLYPRVAKGLRGAGRAEIKAYEAAHKAMDSAESGFGAELIGAQYVGDLWEAARPMSRVFSLLDTFEMTAPSAYLPVEVDIPEMLFVSESTSSSASNYTTSPTGSQRVAVTAKKLLIHQMWSGEIEEDSIIPFLPFLRRQAALAIAHYSDSLVLNGDDTNAGTGNINLDDADPADTKHYLAFDGIRHAGLVDNTANRADAAGVVTYNMLRTQLTRMLDTTRFVDWGHPTDPNDVVYVTDPTTGERISQLDEVLTVDKYGAAATILTGELAKIARNPLVTSMAMSRTEADGKVSTTANNNTLGQVVCFNRRGFKVGWRRRVKIETERLPGTDQTRIVYSLRMGLGRFTPTGAASGIEAADVLYNITI
jgi:hypothetical protein